VGRDSSTALTTGGSPAEPLGFADEVTSALEMLTRRWTPQIVLLLSRQPARFNEVARLIPGLSKRLVGERLRELQAAGLVSRRVDPGPPITAVYSLTAEGERLSPLFDNIWTFAEELSRTAAAERTDS
jgi:DNA-binding HxlR family transcriptional regulator